MSNLIAADLPEHPLNDLHVHPRPDFRQRGRRVPKLVRSHPRQASAAHGTGEPTTCHLSGCVGGTRRTDPGKGNAAGSLSAHWGSIRSCSTAGNGTERREWFFGVGR